MAASPSNTVLESSADGTARENEDDNNDVPVQSEDDNEGEGDVPVQSGLDESAAAAVLATFSTSEHRLFLKRLRDNAHPENRAWMLSVLEEFLAQRYPEEKHEQDYAASAAATTLNPVAKHALMQSARREARADAEAQVKPAMESIMYAQKILQCCGGDGIADLQIIELLHADTDPLAQGAAQAQQLVHRALLNCPAGAKKAVKKADRDVRDIVMLRCRAVCKDPKDRDEFLGQAAQAYGGGELDKEVREQLLLSYHKNRKNQQCGFVSNNGIAAFRRGGPRPRRRRPKANNENIQPCEPDDEQPDDSPDTGPDGASCCRVAAPEPKYVPLPTWNPNPWGIPHEQWYYWTIEQDRCMFRVSSESTWQAPDDLKPERDQQLTAEAAATVGRARDEPSSRYRFPSGMVIGPQQALNANPATCDSSPHPSFMAASSAEAEMHQANALALSLDQTCAEQTIQMMAYRIECLQLEVDAYRAWRLRYSDEGQQAACANYAHPAWSNNYEKTQ